MMAITALSDLTYSVPVGLVMALVIFVYKYGKKGAIKAIFWGQVSILRGQKPQRPVASSTLGKLSMIMQLHRYLSLVLW